MMKKYDRLIAELYACCTNQEEYPHESLLIDTDKMSAILEYIFLQEGLLKED